jgi:DNA-binding CsgD family transcriptional regulator
VFPLNFSRYILIQAEVQTGHLKAVKAIMELAIAAGVRSGVADARKTVYGALITGDRSFLPPVPRHFDIPDADGPLLYFANEDLLHGASLAWIHGDREAASFCYDRLLKWKGTFWDSSTDAELGRLCTVLDRIDEAAEHFGDAIAFCRRAGYLPEMAWTISDYAESLVRRAGPADLERAAALFDEALPISRTLGMTPLEKRILAAREALSGSSGRRRAERDGLTHREVEVLRLVSRGFTNAQIAERLFVSPPTVARHIHNLLDKTGMANRAEVTAWAARSGFLGDK